MSLKRHNLSLEKLELEKLEFELEQLDFELEKLEFKLDKLEDMTTFCHFRSIKLFYCLYTLRVTATGGCVK